MLKADLHMHTKEDPQDHNIAYSAKDIIRRAAKLKFDVISITNHKSILYNNDLKRFAKKRGILLIKGTEAKPEKKEVLVYDSDRVPKTFDELEKLHDDGCLVAAPHPFYPGRECLHGRLIENIKIFDAIEYSYFYSAPLFNFFNQKAVKIAEKYKKAVVGNSDAHIIEVFGYTYSLVGSELDKDSFFEAIRKRKVEYSTKQIPLHLFLKMLFRIFQRHKFF